MTGCEKLLEVTNLKKYYQASSGKYVTAVDDVSFFIRKGETLGLVGESGCGKSTIGRTIIRLHKPTDGKVLLEGNDVHGYRSKKETKQITKKMQMIFQDPYASLNPKMKIADILSEGLQIHGIVKGKKERIKRVDQLLELVGLDRGMASRYPHEFSGGQRQRIGIARALAIQPELIIADEPIAALDVSIQAQIVNLLKELQQNFALTYLFIAHDISIVKYISDRIAVMYLGELVEIGTSEQICYEPKHPYTKALLASVPIADPIRERAKESINWRENSSSPETLKGCKFRSRCVHAREHCSRVKPKSKCVDEDHFVSCHLYDGSSL